MIKPEIKVGKDSPEGLEYRYMKISSNDQCVLKRFIGVNPSYALFWKGYAIGRGFDYKAPISVNWSCCGDVTILQHIE